MKPVFVILLICSSFLKVKGSFRCDDSFLKNQCTSLLRNDRAWDCRGDTLQVFPKCLYITSECKRRGLRTKAVYTHSANVNYSIAYERLAKKVTAYRRCFTRNWRTCNESMIQDCYERFMQNSTKSCKDVHNLRTCILNLQTIGCHEMRNPWYTLAVGIIKNDRSCFIQNYTILLEALQQREVPTVDVVRNRTNATIVVSQCGYPNYIRKPNYIFFGAVLLFVVLAFGVLTLLVWIKRRGLPRKGRRSLLNPGLTQNHGHLEPLHTRTCVTDGAIPLTLTANDGEAPPPYYGVFAALVDSPPPYTSRPTSVNGDFV